MGSVGLGLWQLQVAKMVLIAAFYSLVVINATRSYREGIGEFDFASLIAHLIRG